MCVSEVISETIQPIWISLDWKGHFHQIDASYISLRLLLEEPDNEHKCGLNRINVVWFPPHENCTVASRLIDSRRLLPTSISRILFTVFISITNGSEFRIVKLNSYQQLVFYNDRIFVFDIINLWFVIPSNHPS